METTLFTKSCAPVALPCSVGQTFIFPCSCQAYMECDVTQAHLITRNCSNGLLWDHIERGCRLLADVLDSGRCDAQKPWARCADIAEHYNSEYLSERCSDTDDNSDDVDGIGGGDGDRGVNTGAIVGGIVAGVVVVLVVVAVVVYMRKRKSQKANFTSSPERKEDSNGYSGDDHIYDDVDENEMESSIKKGPKISFIGLKTEDGNFRAKEVESLQGRSLQQSPGGALHLSVPKLEHGSHSNTHKRVDQSRSISIDGRIIPVQDAEGYEIGYPSGSIPRQKAHSVQESVDSGKHYYLVLENR